MEDIDVIKLLNCFLDKDENNFETLIDKYDILRNPGVATLLLNNLNPLKNLFDDVIEITEEIKEMISDAIKKNDFNN
jgi:hypothetical protein